MARSKLLVSLGQLIPARKSIAGSLQLLTSVVFIVMVVALVVGYSWLSSAISHADRMGSSQNYGSTLASLLARPISLGDYAPVEQSLRDSTLPAFICSVHVVTSAGKTIASVNNDRSPRCRGAHEIRDLSYQIHAAGTLDPMGEQDQGSVVLSVEMDDLRQSTTRSVVAALMGGIVVLFVLLLFNSVAVDWALMGLRRAVLQATKAKSGAAAALSGDWDGASPITVAPREIQPLLERLTSLYGTYAKAEGDIRAGKVARQVAHDIRSPLAALEMAGQSKNVPETERIIIRQASHRIRDIANDLTGRFREVHVDSAPAPSDGTPGPQLLPVLIDEIVTEMRLRYRQRSGLEITANLDASNYGLFAAVEPSKFRRVLSNLIQNAVEAIREAGCVTIRSEALDGDAVIAITDTGKGIAPDLLPVLGERGATFGKPGGTGLGLHNAKEMVGHWNGTLGIDSTPGQGTTVRLSLPFAEPPEWFVPKLELETGSMLVVLDDDQSIHQIWNERLSPWTEGGAVKLLHFNSAQELRQWFTANEPAARLAKYLVDFELIGESDTGLSLVRELGIRNRAVLVTSRYDERDVRMPCEKDQIRLIPKGLAAFVPIAVETRQDAPKFRAVLIDDDRFTHRMWTLAAAKTQGRILAVTDLAGIDGHAVEADTPIYVDRNLADGVRGEDVLRKLRERGFTRLYLFTGDTLSDEARAEISFVTGVVGKSLPPEVQGQA